MFFLMAAAPQQSAPPSTPAQPAQTQPEKHLRTIKQLTFGGQNAEAYFSADGKKLIFQSTREPVKCDQIFTMNTDGSDQHMVSTGKGRTTCWYSIRTARRFCMRPRTSAAPTARPSPTTPRDTCGPSIRASTFSPRIPTAADLKQLTKEPGYDAEATISSDGKKIVFTSIRNGDLDIYIMDADGTNVKQLTHELGYDGGPFFSPDGKLIVYRAHHPKTEQEINDYKDLLAQNLIRPTYLEIWIMKADGSDKRQITDLGAASFAPAFYPDGKHIIFSSNVGSTGGMGNFELYGVDLDGKNLERLTFTDGFDGFPMFSPDGKKLVWISGRNAKVPHETNVFIADWIP